MMWGWEVVRRFPGAVFAAESLWWLWAIAVVAVMRERRRRAAIVAKALTTPEKIKK